MSEDGVWPRFRFAGEAAVLVDFAETYSEATRARIVAFDAALNAAPFPGFRESAPSYRSVLVAFDPLTADPAAMLDRLRRLASGPAPPIPKAETHRVAVCYGGAFGPDLEEAARRTGLSTEGVIAVHSQARYRVVAYGFAPGYAYLHGTPDALALPRKEAAVANVPAGSVMITGAQALVTPLTMPSGWWVIGRSPDPVLSPEADPPVRFAVGDEVRFFAIDAAAYGARARR